MKRTNQIRGNIFGKPDIYASSVTIADITPGLVSADDAGELQGGGSVPAGSITLDKLATSVYTQTGSADKLLQLDADGLASARGFKALLMNTEGFVKNTRDGEFISQEEITNDDISDLADIAYDKLNLAGSIVNADISGTAAIADTKLATISSTGKVANSATTATSTLTNNAIVARDSSGNFTANNIKLNALQAEVVVVTDIDKNLDYRTYSSSAATVNSFVQRDSTGGIIVDKLTAVSAQITDLTVNAGVLKSDASGNISTGLLLNANVHASAGIVDTKLATISSTGKVANSATTATSANTASAIVARDANGDFSARTINLVGNISVANASSGAGQELCGFYQSGATSGETFFSVGKNTTNAAYMGWHNANNYADFGVRGTANCIQYKYVSTADATQGVYMSIGSDISGAAPVWSGVAGLYVKGQLQIDATYGGFDPPQVTTTQRDNAGFSKRAGTLIWNTTASALEFYNGTTWKQFTLL